MGRIAEMVHEVSVWASLAVTMAGLEDLIDIIDDELDFDLRELDDPALDGDCRSILFETSDGQVLPIQVVCTRTALAILISGDEDDGTEGTTFMTPARPISDLEGFLTDLQGHLSSVCTTPTKH